MPDGFLDLGTKSILSIPVLDLIALVVLAVVGYYLHNRRGGRELYAIGSDPEAAVLYGLHRTPPRARRVRPLRRAGRTGRRPLRRPLRHVSSGAGHGLELQAVGAAVIGGVAIFGGSGTVWGAAIGAFLLVTINRALPVLGIPDFWQRAVVGALIIGAIVPRPGARAQRQTRTAASKRGTSHEHLRRPHRRHAGDRAAYPAYSRPLGAGVLLTREFAVIALLLVVVLLLATTTCPPSTAR